MAIGYKIIVILICIAILQCIYKVLNKVWFKPRKLEKILRQQRLVGNSYKLLYGDHHENSKLRSKVIEKSISFTNDYYSRVYPYFHQLANRYGENYFTWNGPTPFLNITNPNLICEAFARMHEFQKIEVSPLVSSLFCGLTSYEGEIWNIHRKLLNPAFHLQKLKFMLPSICTSGTKLVSKWDELLSRTSSCEIDLCPYLTTTTADAISRAAFGTTYEEGRIIFELLTELHNNVAPITNSIYFPGWKYVPTKSNRRVRNTNAKLEYLLKKVIENKKKAIKNGEGRNDDLLGILIKSSLEKEGINYRELIDECKLFYFVGHETTTLFLVWTIILLSKHQDWQTRAREEVLATFGMNPPDFDGLHRLKIMKMILNEVLRLYPPSPSVMRMIRAGDTTLGDLHLPKGLVLGLSILHVHHNSKFWGDDAKEFKPERFANGIGKATNGTTTFFLFGWGPRSCIGQNFSTLEAKVILSLILQRFAFELSPSYIHAPVGVITLKPQHGAQVILRRV